MAEPDPQRPDSSSKAPQRQTSGSSHSYLSKDNTGAISKEMEAVCAREDTISIAESSASTISSNHTTPSKRPAPHPTLSRMSSVSPDAIIVDKKHRRGLFARFSLIPEVNNANHYVNRTKWLITTVIAFCGMCGPMGSAIVMPVLQEIRRDFDASPVIANMSVGVYMLAMGIFPLWWSSFSETGGRRSIYIISFALFVVFAVLSAVATNITMLVVVRTLSGGAAASVQAVGAGTIADLWEMRERGRALGLFYLGPLCGPLLAPIFGGALGQGLGWRSTQWFLVIYGGITLVLIIFCLPETLCAEQMATNNSTATPPQPSISTSSEKEKDAGSNAQPLSRTTTRQSIHNTSKTFLQHTHRTLIDPLSILLWLRYPPVALTVYYASITFGSLYFLNISLQATFSLPPYNFSTLILGLLYIPGSLGYFLASIFGGRWIDKIMAREARKADRYDGHGRLVLRPEDRMRENAWIAAFLWPCALIAYGWTAEKGVHWIVPMISNFFFGVGSMLIFTLSTTMLTEFLPRRASSGVAINNFCRSLFCFVGAVAAEPAIETMGNGWLMTVLGVWSLGSGVAVIWAMRRWGPGWREKMVRELG